MGTKKGKLKVAVALATMLSIGLVGTSISSGITEVSAKEKKMGLMEYAKEKGDMKVSKVVNKGNNGYVLDIPYGKSNGNFEYIMLPSKIKNGRIYYSEFTNTLTTNQPILTYYKGDRKKYYVKNGYVYKGGKKYSGEILTYELTDSSVYRIQVKNGKVASTKHIILSPVLLKNPTVVKNKVIDTTKSTATMKLANGKKALGGTVTLKAKGGYIYKDGKKANVTVYSGSGKGYKISKGKFSSSLNGRVLLKGDRDNIKYEENIVTLKAGKVTKVEHKVKEYIKVVITGW